MWQRIVQSPDWRYVALTLVLTALLQLVGPEWFRFERDWAESGQIWRLVSAHWVHVNWKHWLINGASLVVLAALTTPRWGIGRWLWQTVLIGLGISLLVTWLNPEVRDYAGHSGVLYGLYLLGAVSLYPRDRLIAMLIVLAVAGRVVLEKLAWFDFHTDDFIGANVILDSHLYGLLLGIAIALPRIAVTMKRLPAARSNTESSNTEPTH